MLNPAHQPMSIEHVAIANTAMFAALISFLRAKHLISPNELRQISRFAKAWIGLNISGEDTRLLMELAGP